MFSTSSSMSKYRDSLERRFRATFALRGWFASCSGAASSCRFRAASRKDLIVGKCPYISSQEVLACSCCKTNLGAVELLLAMRDVASSRLSSFAASGAAIDRSVPYSHAVEPDARACVRIRSLMSSLLASMEEALTDSFQSFEYEEELEPSSRRACMCRAR